MAEELENPDIRESTSSVPHPSENSDTAVDAGISAANIQWLGITLALLFFIKLLLPFITLLSIFLLSLLCLLLLGVVVIRLPKHSENNIRAQFPRLNFTKAEEWERQLSMINKNDTFTEPYWASRFNKATDTLIEYVIRDFISSWFKSISDSDAFPNELRVQLRRAFYEVEKRAQEIDISNFLILDLVPLLTKHLSNVCAASESVIGEKTISGSTELELAVAKEFDNIYKLHPFISLKSYDTEKDKKSYARDRVSKIIWHLLPKNELKSGPVEVLVREIMTNTIIFPLLRLLSDSDFWNQMLVKFSAATLKDRDQVRELRNAIEEQYNNPNSKQAKTEPHGPLFDSKVTPQMKQPQFQSYIKDIDRSNSVSSLKQLKYYVAVQLSRTHRIHSTSEKFLKYTKRLNIAKDRIDKRIDVLSNTEGPPQNTNIRDSSLLNHDVGAFINNLTLSQILGNPSSLSFFMEFMEQRSRTVLLQYWLTVQGIKDPLEDPHNPDYDEELSLSADITGSEDIKQIFLAFFGNNLLRIDHGTYNEVEQFANGNERNIEKYLKVRQLILVLQAEVFKRMEDRDFPDFKSSDLFLKLLASESFEQSLVSTVDGPHDHDDDDDDQYDDEDANAESTSLNGTGVDNEVEESEESLFELENALTDILNKDHPPPSTPSMMSSRANSKKSSSTALKNDLFGSEEDGFLDQKPLFEDSEEDDLLEDGIDELDDEKLDTDTDFYPLSHDALNTKEDISTLDQEIEKLTKQSEMLDPLILKAELTNNSNELRLLKKSKSSYEREIDAKELLKQQLIVQENENSLFGKTTISINSWIKQRSKGRDFIVYLIEIQKASSKEGGSPSSTWMVGRRFNQFYKMNELLRHECPEVETIPFPKKKIVLKFQQKFIIDERREQLQSYIRQLLEMPKVCQNKEFRRFLTVEDYRATSVSLFSPSTDSSRFEIKGAANKIYNGLYSGIDMLSNKQYRASDDHNVDDGIVVTAASTNNNTTTNDEISGSQAEDMRKELENFENERVLSKSFVKPITDLFIALFPLNSTNSWLRGRAIIVVLQQVLGSTIEKHIKSQITGVSSEEKMIEMMVMLQDILWPEGQFMQSGPPRSTGEKLKSKKEAKLLLETLMMDTLSKFVGQSGSKNASNRIYGMLQNETLNTNLVYEILDKVFESLFPEINGL